MNDAKPAKIPNLGGLQLHAAAQQDDVIDTALYPYREALAILRYLVDSTRPDLAFIANALARHSRCPTKLHMKSLKHIARYLIRKSTHSILFKKWDAIIKGAADADFANFPDTRQSTYTYIIQHGHNPVSCASKRIKMVVNSTFAAEYIAATSQKVKSLRTLYQQITNERLPSSPLSMDNQGAIIGAQSAVSTRKTKYIDIRHHILQQRTKQGIIMSHSIPTNALVADLSQNH